MQRTQSGKHGRSREAKAANERTAHPQRNRVLLRNGEKIIHITEEQSMASSKTQNYALPQWQGTDPFSMAEFNDTFAKIDTAIANAQSKANQAAQAAAQGLKVVSGTYTGDGTASRTISLGATPKLIIVALYGAATFADGYFYGGFATPTCPTRAVTIVEGGFQLTHKTSTPSNSQDTEYTYFALL